MNSPRSSAPPDRTARPGAAESPPILNAPPVVIILIAALAAAYAVLLLAPHNLAASVEVLGAVSPRRFLIGLGHPLFALLGLLSLFTHMFLHAGLMHLGLNSVWLLAFGTPVARRLGGERRRGAVVFVGLFLLSGAAGALLYILLHPAQYTLLVGASGGVSGLLGGLVRFAFRRPGEGRPDEMGFSSLTDRNVVIWTVAIFAMNLLVVFLGAAISPELANIAWEAHMGGYFFGLVFMPAAAKIAATQKADF